MELFSNALALLNNDINSYEFAICLRHDILRAICLLTQTILVENLYHIAYEQSEYISQLHLCNYIAFALANISLQNKNVLFNFENKF